MSKELSVRKNILKDEVMNNNNYSLGAMRILNMSDYYNYYKLSNYNLPVENSLYVIKDTLI